MSNREGDIIGRRYRLTARLGSGGQGTVYRGVDLQDGDEVAIKVTEPVTEDPEWRERIFREAHALTVLTGTAAVRVLHQAWTADGAFCLVTELLHGTDLEAFLREREVAGETLDPRRLLPALLPIVDTLEVAHAGGILHRDLKPSNIFILHDGSARLLDFGFAKFTRMPPVTQAGMVAGSPYYIAPEIWQSSRVLGPGIDVYSLGAILYRALAGFPPFQAEHLQDLLRLVTSAPRPSLHALRPDLPEKIDAWVAHALAVSPLDRFSSPRALHNALVVAVQAAG
ncbi:MAG: serine/threonine-protein kinase [Polyangiaceae bacterium]|jgi:serine/threonine-protein kinase